MTAIQSGLSIYNPQVKAIDMNSLKMVHVSRASEEQYQQYIQSQESFLKARYSQGSNQSESQAYQPYATVKVAGKVVAEIDNHGFTQASNAIAGRLQNLFSNEPVGMSGPQLAQARAEKTAEALGGEVVKSSTAMTQAQFNARPSETPSVDYQAMQEDPMYGQLQKTKQARTLFLAQQLAQENEVEAPPVEKITLDSSLGAKSFDIDEHFSPNSFSGPIDLKNIPLLLPTARNIEALSGHASGKLQDLLKDYNIPAGPEQISYGGLGQIKFPNDYPYADELTQALQENPALERELRTVAALASHHAGMQSALQGNGRARNTIALNLGPDGKIDVTVNGIPLDVSDPLMQGLSAGQLEHTADSNGDSSADSTTSEPLSSARQAFLDYMSKTPEERYFEALLAEEGLTKEQLDALPPEERVKIEKKIRDKMEEQLMGKVAEHAEAADPQI